MALNKPSAAPESNELYDSTILAGTLEKALHQYSKLAKGKPTQHIYRPTDNVEYNFDGPKPKITKTPSEYPPLDQMETHRGPLGIVEYDVTVKDLTSSEIDQVGIHESKGRVTEVEFKEYTAEYSEPSGFVTLRMHHSEDGSVTLSVDRKRTFEGEELSDESGEITSEGSLNGEVVQEVVKTLSKLFKEELDIKRKKVLASSKEKLSKL